MFIACARVEIIIYDAQSLKDKRRVIQSLTTRMRNKFNVSIAEVDLMDRWQRGALGIACVANSSIYAQKQLDKVLLYMEEDQEFEMGIIEKEIL